MSTPRSKRTVGVEEAAQMLGVSRNTAYREIHETDQLAGVPVIRVGKQLLLPRAPLERLLDGEAESAAVTN
jgi:excisionase family DNA binding protein